MLQHEYAAGAKVSELCRLKDLEAENAKLKRLLAGAVLGWDTGAALALAQALGNSPLIAAELLPDIEAVMVRKLNEQSASSE